MNPGILRHRVRLEGPPATAPDGLGGGAEAWPLVEELWAHVQPLNATERYRQHQEQHAVTHRVTIRYRTGVSTKQRLVFDGRVLEIMGIINPTETTAYLILECVESEPEL